MGDLTSKMADYPIQNVYLRRCSHPSLQIGGARVQNRRLHMEDEIVVLESKAYTIPFFIVAVCDGHSGKDVSRWLKREIPKAFSPFMTIEDIRNQIHQMDHRIRQECASEHGSTLVLALLRLHNRKWTISIAHVGDSRAVLIGNQVISRADTLASDTDTGILSKETKEGWHIWYETADHVPTDFKEAQRVMDAGSCVSNNRLDGNLAMTRAMGDFSIKQRTKALICDPTIQQFSFSEDCLFELYLFSDGLFEDTVARVDRKNETVNLVHFFRSVSPGQQVSSYSVCDLGYRCAHLLLKTTQRNPIVYDNLSLIMVQNHFPQVWKEETSTFPLLEIIPILSGENMMKDVAHSLTYWENLRDYVADFGFIYGETNLLMNHRFFEQFRLVHAHYQRSSLGDLSDQKRDFSSLKPIDTILTDGSFFYPLPFSFDFSLPRDLSHDHPQFFSRSDLRLVKHERIVSTSPRWNQKDRQIDGSFLIQDSDLEDGYPLMIAFEKKRSHHILFRHPTHYRWQEPSLENIGTLGLGDARQVTYYLPSEIEFSPSKVLPPSCFLCLPGASSKSISFFRSGSNKEEKKTELKVYQWRWKNQGFEPLPSLGSIPSSLFHIKQLNSGDKEPHTVVYKGKWLIYRDHFNMTLPIDIPNQEPFWEAVSGDFRFAIQLRSKCKESKSYIVCKIRLFRDPTWKNLIAIYPLKLKLSSGTIITSIQTNKTGSLLWILTQKGASLVLSKYLFVA
jgi:serine/threonine protein phosphatase PrpC